MMDQTLCLPQLTEEEMINIQDRCGVTILRDEFIAIEAKLKELNA